MNPVTNTMSSLLEIHDEVVKFFRSATLQVKQRDGATPQRVVVWLKPEGPFIELTKAVSRQLFSMHMQRMALELQEAEEKNFSRHQVEVPVSASFQLQDVALSGLRAFQRFMYPRDGKDAKVLKEYLHWGGSDSQVKALRLDPKEVEKQVTEDNSLPFQAAIEGLAPNDPAIFNLRRLYPKMTAYLKDIQRQEEREIRERMAKEESPYTKAFNAIQNRVIGQAYGARMMASVLAKAGNGNCVFLFVGPTGVGKTEMAKAAAELKNNRFVSFGMEQYISEVSATSFFGSSPGYVGSEDRPPFAARLAGFIAPNDIVQETPVRSKRTVRDMVILFDEIEKAHSKLQLALLSLLDEGGFTVNFTQNRRNVEEVYKLERCVIICTSNLFQDRVVQALQSPNPEIAGIEDTIRRENAAMQGNPLAEHKLKPELMGRMKYVVPFGPIPRGADYQKLLEIKLDLFCVKMQQELGCKIVVEQMPEVLRILEDKLYGEGIDNRRIDRYLTSIEYLITQHCGSWGRLADKELVLYPAVDALFMGVFLVDFTGEVSRIDDIPPILL